MSSRLQVAVLPACNYDLSYQGNNLTITKALLNVIADAKTKVYGDVMNKPNTDLAQHTPMMQQ